VTLTSKEVTQIEEYADAVINDERFMQPNVSWNFWLIGNDLDRVTNAKRNQTGMPFGCIHRTDRYTIQVRTWAEVLHDAKHRLKFVERSLSYQVSHDGGVRYLRETHAKYLPEALADPEGPRLRRCDQVIPLCWNWHMAKITISIPDDIAEKANRAVAAGLAPSVSVWFATLAQREPDWAAAGDTLIAWVKSDQPAAASPTASALTNAIKAGW
jgi:hypothetical protein